MAAREFEDLSKESLVKILVELNKELQILTTSKGSKKDISKVRKEIEQIQKTISFRDPNIKLR
jgi:hypothetical protein